MDKKSNAGNLGVDFSLGGEGAITLDGNVVAWLSSGASVSRHIAEKACTTWVMTGRALSRDEFAEMCRSYDIEAREIIRRAALILKQPES